MVESGTGKAWRDRPPARSRILRVVSSESVWRHVVTCSGLRHGWRVAGVLALFHSPVFGALGELGEPKLMPGRKSNNNNNNNNSYNNNKFGVLSPACIQ